MRDAIRFASRVHELAFQRLLRRKSHGVQEQVELAKLFAHGFEHQIDVLVLRYVAGHERLRTFGLGPR